MAEARDRAEAERTAAVATAIDALTTADTERLERFARYRMRALGNWARGKDAHDLLYQAITDTLTGDRTWSSETVDFVRHLLMTMRSIADRWQKRLEQKDTLESQLQPQDDDVAHDVLGHLQPSGAIQERTVVAKEQLEAIGRAIADDPELQDIAECRRQGFTGPETMDLLDISENQYRAAIKRLRRRAEAAIQELETHQGGVN